MLVAPTVYYVSSVGPVCDWTRPSLTYTVISSAPQPVHSAEAGNMHTLYSRVNNVSAMLSTCLMALLAAISLSSFLFTATPRGDLAVSSIQVYVMPLV